MLFCDNGSEFTSQIMDLWAYQNGVKIDFSRPGKPTDNAFVESFNGTLRAECLDTHWFGTLAEAKESIEAWRREYNESRPHRSPGERTPSEFRFTNRRKLALTVLQKKGTAHSGNSSFTYQQSTRYMNSPERTMTASRTAQLTIELGLGDSPDESSMTSSFSRAEWAGSGRYSR